MLTSRCLHTSANEANPYQHSTESWHSLCKTQTYLIPNSYTFHTSPTSNTLLEHDKKPWKTYPKIHRWIYAQKGNKNISKEKRDKLLSVNPDFFKKLT